jgi:hypothetical protein
MKYMFLLYGPDLPAPGTEEAATLLAEWAAARQAMAEAGVLIECDGLDDALKWAARLAVSGSCG